MDSQKNLKVLYSDCQGVTPNVMVVDASTGFLRAWNSQSLELDSRAELYLICNHARLRFASTIEVPYLDKPAPLGAQCVLPPFKKVTENANVTSEDAKTVHYFL